MANTLGVYDPIFYAQEALIQLEKVLGMANAVHRGFDSDPQQKGQQIQIRRPGSFTSQAMPISSATDLTTETVSITLDQWEGVRFGLRDDELTFTKEQIINEHIRPAAVAVADAVDVSLAGLYVDIPWFYNTADPGAVGDFTGTRKLMFDNKVPTSQRTIMLNGEREADYLALAVFHQANTAGAAGEIAQREGFLGRKFGFDIFANQNVQVHTTGTAASGDNLGAVNGAHAVGVTSIAVNGFTGSETVVAGDTFSIAGDTQRYAVTAGSAWTTGAGSIAFFPALKVAVSGGEVVTINPQTKLNENLAFHRHAFALAMAPLSTMGNGAGARIGRATDPLTSLSLRSRLWYDGDTAKVNVGLDALWGRKTLNPDLAVRMNS